MSAAATDPLIIPIPETVGDLSTECPCILCDKVFPFDESREKTRRLAVEKIRAHLVKDHRFVIADIDDVPDFPAYAAYWKEKLVSTDLTHVCCVIRTNTGPNDVEAPVDYYMITPDSLPEDKLLREQLTITRLNKVLRIQEKERNDNEFSRQCLFCRKIFTGNRSVLFDHLVEDHNLNVGHPDNLVFVQDFLDEIETKLHSLRCLFCENLFTDWDAMKEHMRKKGHKQLNPDSKHYDRYYLINYLEHGRTFRTPDAVHVSWDNEEKDTNDWVGRAESLICLFCSRSSGEFEELSQHMEEAHKFSFSHFRSWPFYKKVKLVNHIRRAVRDNSCFSCKQKFETRDGLTHHLTSVGEGEHASHIPSNELDEADNFIPVLENDLLLSYLPDDGEDEAEELDAELVIGEEIRKIDLNELPIELQQLIGGK